MTRWYIALALVGAAALVLFQLWDVPIAAAIAKLAASTGFVAAAVSVGALRWHFGRTLLAGLALSWFGDAFLLGGSDALFLMGLGSFLLAHVMYCIAFFIRGVDWSWAGIALVPVVLISAGVSLWLTPHVSADMLLPVRVYTGVISVMVILAFGTKGAGGPWLIPVGAALFYFSDLSVAAGQFVKPAFPNYVWGLPFYYVGQVLLALSARWEDTSAHIPAAPTDSAPGAA